MTGSYPRVFAIVCFLVLMFSSLLAAETVKIEGLIVGRSGDEIIVRFGSGAELAFQLTDNTQVSQVGGLINARKKQMAMVVLIPGLKVKVEGVYNQQRQVLATKINFKGSDLEDAKKVQAGMHPLKVQNEQQQEELDRQNANVTNILLQKGHVTLPRILAPRAMGEAHQVADDNSAEGQAENRRVVVRVLQNKAIAGI